MLWCSEFICQFLAFCFLNTLLILLIPHSLFSDSPHPSSPLPSLPPLLFLLLFHLLILNFPHYSHAGTIDLKLDQIPKAMTYPERCSLEQLLDWNPKAKSDDLFKKKRIKGWWPVYSDKFGKENREMKVRRVLDYCN